MEGPADSLPVPPKRVKLSEPPKNRTFKKIPIFIVDYHNDVLQFINRCMGARFLPIENNVLVHFDSHPDMVISRKISAPDVYKMDLLLPELSIENWIMPSCYSGIFNKLIWIKNDWCDQIPVGDYNFTIGDRNDIIHVDMPIDYFIGEGNYCDKSLMINRKEMKLQVTNANDIDSKELLITKNDKTYILDIDLDFFSTTNPFLQVYDYVANINKMLTEIFKYKEGADLSDANETSYNRRIQLDGLRTVFDHLELNRTLNEYENKSIPEPVYEQIEELYRLMRQYYMDTSIDWNLVFDYGCTCDNDGLPHHISTPAELLDYYVYFENYLRKLPNPPIAITIARSSEDDYCPKVQVDAIQSRVLLILQQVYGDKLTDEPIMQYKDESWDIMEYAAN